MLDEMTAKRDRWAKNRKYNIETDTWYEKSVIDRAEEEPEEAPAEEEPQKMDEIMKNVETGEKGLSDLKEPVMREVPPPAMRPLDEAFKKELYPIAKQLYGNRTGDLKTGMKNDRTEISEEMRAYMDRTPMIRNNVEKAQALLDQIEEGVIFGGKTYEEMSNEVKRLQSLQKMIDFMGEAQGVKMKNFLALASEERLNSLKGQAQSTSASEEPDDQAYEAARDQFYAPQLAEWQKKKAAAEKKYQSEMAEYSRKKKILSNLDEESIAQMLTENRNKATKQGGKKVENALYDLYRHRENTEAKNEKAQDLALNIYTSTAYRRMVNIMQFGIFGRYKTLEPKKEGTKVVKAAYGGDKVDRAMGGDALEQASHAIRVSARIALDALREGGRGTKKDNGEGIIAFRGENIKDGISYAAGSTFSTKKLTSTSQSMDMAYGYYKGVEKEKDPDSANLSVIKLTGENGVSVDEMSINPDYLKEVVLPYDLKFRVVKERTKYVSYKELKDAENSGNVDSFASLQGDEEDAQGKLSEWNGDENEAESKKTGRIHISVSEEIPDGSARSSKLLELKDKNSPAAKRQKELIASLLQARMKLEAFANFR